MPVLAKTPNVEACVNTGDENSPVRDQTTCLNNSGIHSECTDTVNPGLPMKQTNDLDKGDLEAHNGTTNVRYGRDRQLTSWGETLVNLLKGNIGSGVLAMGDAFRNAGLVVAPALTLGLAVACVHSQHILLKCSRKLGRNTGNHQLDFAETVEKCFAEGPEFARRRKDLARQLVNTFLCITQLGFCCVYFVFIANNIKQVMDEYVEPLDVRLYMAFTLPLVILISWIRSLKHLAPASAVANVLMAAGLTIALYFCSVDLPPFSERKAFAGWASLPLYFGTAIFAFEGIGLVMPMQNEMKRPQHFAAPLGVLNIGMTMVTVLFTAVGFLGYLKYGEEVMGSITLNLPADSILAQAVKVMVSIAMLVTYAVQFYVPMDILWPSIRRKLFPQDLTSSAAEIPSRLVPEFVFRTALVLLTFTLAELIPELDLAISLVGAVSSTTLALLFPPLSELMLLYGTSGSCAIPRHVILKDVALIILGLIGFATGTYASILGIIHAYNDSDTATSL